MWKEKGDKIILIIMIFLLMSQMVDAFRDYQIHQQLYQSNLELWESSVELRQEILNLHQRALDDLEYRNRVLESLEDTLENLHSQSAH